MSDLKTKTPQTTAQLQDILWEQLERMRVGDTTPAAVNAVVAATSSLLRIVKMQMEYAEKTGKMPNIPLLAMPADAE